MLRCSHKEHKEARKASKGQYTKRISLALCDFACSDRGYQYHAVHD